MNEDKLATASPRAFSQESFRVGGTNDYIDPRAEAERVRKLNEKGGMSQWGELGHPSTIAALMMGGALRAAGLGSMGTGAGGGGGNFLSKLFGGAGGSGGGNIWQTLGKRAASAGMQSLLQPQPEPQPQFMDLLPPPKVERLEDINKILENMKKRGTLNA